MSRTAITGSTIPEPALAYSPAIRFGDLIFVSGQASTDDRGAHVPSTFADEFALTITNLSRILEVAGSSLDHVLHSRVYLGKEEFRKEFNELYSQFFSVPYPARTAVAGGIGNLKIEIDVVAAIPSA